MDVEIELIRVLNRRVSTKLWIKMKKFNIFLFLIVSTITFAADGGNAIYNLFA